MVVVMIVKDYEDDHHDLIIITIAVILAIEKLKYFYIPTMLIFSFKLIKLGNWNSIDNFTQVYTFKAESLFWWVKSFGVSQIKIYTRH